MNNFVCRCQKSFSAYKHRQKALKRSYFIPSKTKFIESDKSITRKIIVTLRIFFPLKHFLPRNQKYGPWSSKTNLMIFESE